MTRKNTKKPKKARSSSKKRDVHIVKRKGHLEVFDERKVYATCFSACLSSHLSQKHAEKISEMATMEVKKWIKTRKEVSSDQIFKKTVQSLKKLDKDVAFMYETHRDIN